MNIINIINWAHLQDQLFAYFSIFLNVVFAFILLSRKWSQAFVILCLNTDHGINVYSNFTQVKDNRCCEDAMDQNVMLRASFIIRFIICYAKVKEIKMTRNLEKRILGREDFTQYTVHHDKKNLKTAFLFLFHDYDLSKWGCESVNIDHYTAGPICSKDGLCYPVNKSLPTG